MPSNLENVFPSVCWWWEEIPFPSPFYLYWFPPGLGISLQSSREVSNFAYSKAFLIQGKPPYIALNCWIQSLAFTVILVTLTIKAKENGTTIIQVTENGGQHNVLCSLRATQSNTHCGALNTLPQFFTSFTNTDMAFLGTAALRASLAVNINFLHSISPLPWLSYQAQHREHSIRVGF